MIIKESLALFRRERSSLFSVIAILSLALGVVVAMSAVISVGVLNAFPYRESSRLLFIHDVYGADDSVKYGISEPEFLDYGRFWSDAVHLAVFRTGYSNVTFDTVPRRLAAAWVSANFFEVLGLGPAFGREFALQEDVPHGPLVVIVSNKVWRSLQGEEGGADVLRKTEALAIEGRSYQIIGVLPSEFRLPAALGDNVDADVIFPLALDRAQLRERGNPVLTAIGRLREGWTLDRIREDTDRLKAQLEAAYPEHYKENVGFHVLVTSLYDDLVGRVKNMLLVVSIAGLSLYCLALSQVGGALVDRFQRRRKEFSIRVVVGATRNRLFQQVLVETGIILLLCLAPGLLCASALLAIISDVKGWDWLPSVSEGLLNMRVSIFICALLSLTLMVLSLSILNSIMRAAESGMVPSMRVSVSSGTRKMRLIYGSIVVSQLAMACALLAGSTLLALSYRNLLNVDLGFQGGGVLFWEISLSSGEKEQAAVAAKFDTIISRIKELPGIVDASAVVFVPLVDEPNIWPVLAGHEERAGVTDAPSAVDVQIVGEDFFRTMGIPLLRGRSFTVTDNPSRAYVIVSKSFAQRFWPDRDPIGSRVRPLVSRDPIWAEVVGIVGDVKYRGVVGEPRPTLYLLYRQLQCYGDFLVPTMHVAIRTRAEPTRLVDTVYREIRSIDHGIPISRIRAFDDLISAITSRERFAMTLLAIFAGIAVGLGVFGLFTLISGMVTRRSHEIGVRMALGASPRSILYLVIRQTLWPTGLGIALGTLLVVIIGRVISHLLFGLNMLEYGMVYVGVVCSLMAACLLASLLPALRGATLPPAQAMRRGLV